ncbi:hypothetical protein [Lactiplantibacillus plantarum]|uniref:hypothetical protein n=1 Tax=Lactiplantibacillus plantarum TaxID=1590 RepID=UPI004046216E
MEEARIAWSVQGLRRPGRAGHAQFQGRAAPPAAFRARRRRTRTGPGRHHRQHRAQRRPPGPAHGPGTPQHGQGADAAGRRRQHGRPHRPRRGTVLRGPPMPTRPR